MAARTLASLTAVKGASLGRAIVAMSGGVDSSVSAFLLKRQGFDVEGVYMHNWDSRDENGSCPSLQDWRDVQRACNHLKIPCRRVDLVKEYWTEVFDPLVAGFARGWTPNPDVMCNRHIKFGRLLELLASKLEDERTWLATGHYAALARDGASVSLLRGADPAKDQSYFLSSLSANQMKKVMFPLGTLCKREVKRIAVEEAAMTWLLDRKESMGICMVGKRKKFGDFIESYLEDQREENERLFVALGESHNHLLHVFPQIRHRGHWQYTIGQAARVPGQQTKHYIAHKSLQSNAVIVVGNPDHPALFRRKLTVKDWQWLSPPPDQTVPIRIAAQVGYREDAAAATLQARFLDDGSEAGEAIVSFDSPVRSAALGQWLAAYQGNKVVGGGTIADLGPWEWPLATEEEIEKALMSLTTPEKQSCLRMT